ncbi:MAG: Ada metal-binding domain-containing protein [bacterium]
MPRLAEQIMIRAMRANDAQYDGKFWVGVHSTGIYCLPSCPAKTPLLKNVVFYTSREEAIAAGLRGCKRCRSERYPDVLPDWTNKLVSFMQSQVSARLKESDLAQAAGVDITTIRRHFRRYLGITPLSFHRRLRLQYARELVEQGADYLTAAFECGYESSSGFREAFEREFGTTPGRINGAQ